VTGPRAFIAIPALVLALALPLALPLASGAGAPDRWWGPGEGRTWPSTLDYPNDLGVLRVLLSGDPVVTKGHPFFEPLGKNGRACITCHQPADAMGLAAATARARWDATDGKDPLFAADGSNCPNLPQERRESHSLLTDHGLIRIQRDWPPRTPDGKRITPDFTLEVAHDPTGCNSGKYGPKAPDPSVSVYRRVRPVANLKYLLATGFEYDPKQSLPLPRDPESGVLLSGNLMADGRASTLNAQARDAGLTHLEFADRLSREQLLAITEFETRIHTAQQRNVVGVDLDSGGAEGGPKLLADSMPGMLGSDNGRPVWSEFAAWENPASDDAQLTPAQREYRASVARGARVFREKTFLITDSAGINSPMGFGNPVRNSCVFCHNMSQMGNDVAPGQVDLGTTTLPFADPAPHLPLFRITCLKDPHPHYGRSILTQDPGFALTTGRCADVGKITLQSMRGLAARAPYFSNGLAKDLMGVVEYYERRYNIGYTEQEKQDLVNLMGAL
jgi:hypothetical protein